MKKIEKEKTPKIMNYYFYSSIYFILFYFANKTVSEIYPLADEIDFSPRLNQNREEKNKMKIQMVLFGYNTNKFIYSKVAYIFPYAGITIFSKMPGHLVTK